LADSLFSRIVETATRQDKVGIADVKLTARELEIVNLIGLGMSNKEIAHKLSVATDTVKSHVHNILEKLSLRSRVHVAVRARAIASTDK
jgi:DNA-binding NarL/FixJ family response regulator